MRVLTLSRNKTHDKLLRKCHFSNLHAKEPALGIPCAGSLLYSLDRLAKHLTQQVCHPLRGLNGIDAVRHIIVTSRLVWKNAAAAPLWSPRHAAPAGTAPASGALPDSPPCGRRLPRSSWEPYIACRCSCT